MSDPNLLPCPFCQSVDIAVSASYVICRGCHADGPVGPDPRKAWNTRSPEPQDAKNARHFRQALAALDGVEGANPAADRAAILIREALKR